MKASWSLWIYYKGWCRKKGCLHCCSHGKVQLPNSQGENHLLPKLSCLFRQNKDIITKLLSDSLTGLTFLGVSWSSFSLPWGTYLSLKIRPSPLLGVFPCNLQPNFDMLYNHVKQLLSNELLLTQMEKCALMEALVLISNQFKNYERQKAFLEELMAPVASIWLSEDLHR